MEEITQEEFDALYAKHIKWLRGEGGERLELNNKLLKNLRWNNYRLNEIILNRCTIARLSAKGAFLCEVEMFCCRVVLSDFSWSVIERSKLIENTFKKNTFYGSTFNGSTMIRNYLGGSNEVDSVEFGNVTIVEPKGIPICSLSGMQGECGRTLTLIAKGKKSKWIFYCGCFSGTLEDMKEWMQYSSRMKGDYRYDSAMASANFLISLVEMRMHEDKRLDKLREQTNENNN